MLNTLLIRVIGAGFAFLSLGLGRAYFDDVAFGTFAYVAQCITILVVFGQSGIEFLMFKSCSRGQLRVVFQIFYVFILSCLPVCIVTLLVVQMITGVPLGATLGIVTLVSALCIILTKCFANISLGFGQDTLYQIWDQGLRWAPLALVMLALLGLQHLSVTSSTVSTTFLLSTSGYLAITAVAVITSSLFRPRRVAFRGPRPRLVAHLFRRGLSFNAPIAMLFFLSVIDQFLLIRILEVGDYGVYRIAALAVTALAMVVDVLGLSIRRRFMAERDAQMRSFVFYELRARFRLLSLVGFIGGVGVL
ncbi:MAG: hypothetical protein KKA05_10960, partial [Alphaproteobacteria bacterium]|nr:hypothetical protein [Alphaproteobacteria bacterium]